METATPPRPLLTCAADPVVPITNDQGVLAGYLADLWAAGEDCRAKLAAVRIWSEGAATE